MRVWKAGRGLMGLMAMLSLAALAAPASPAQEPSFKPGYNLFSKQQDIQLGREASQEIEKEVRLLTDTQVVGYVSDLGQRLARLAPRDADVYPWEFKVVDSQEINAFALPGGFIYVNRGVLEAAENEAQLAGVIAHETGHVVMRHGTHRATQVMIAQMPLAILGGVLGRSTSIGAQLAQLGIGLGLNSILLKNSRGAESQSDEIGTYILYKAGYDPHAMAEFFEIIAQKYPQRTIEFFSDHPNPENRIKKVDALIARLGPPNEARKDSREFELAKNRILGMPVPPKGEAAPTATASAHAPAAPAAPSNRLVGYRGEGFAIAYPDNWEVRKSDGGLTLAPPGGLVSGPQGDAAQAYGASISRYMPARDQSLSDATQKLIDSLRYSNPNLRVVGQSRFRVNRRAALSTLLENDSPLEGQKEIDRLITVSGRDGVLAVVFIAPQSAYDAYQATFSAMLGSLRVR